MIEEQLRFRDVYSMREATLQRWIRSLYFEDMLTLHLCDASISDGNLIFYEFARAKLDEMKAGSSRELPRLISGEDLIQLGLTPGPMFAEILSHCEDLALEGQLKTKEDALDHVLRVWVK